MKPLCFVIMPFGEKKDADGGIVNFDLIYNNLIHPAIVAADMEPIRADEETVNGIIHKPMYERLILCDYAIADLTTANANVFYELGIRHAVKPFTTVTIFSKGSTLPFDLNAVRCYPYSYNKQEGVLNGIDKDLSAITEKLKRAKSDKATDSPIYQLVDGIAFQNSVAHQKTDIFRDLVKYNKAMKDRLAELRHEEISDIDKIAKLNAFVSSEIKTEDEEAGTLIDIMLTYRSLSAFDQMISFINSLPTHVKNTVMVQEQLGFALNRIGKGDKAISVLKAVLEQNGPSSETYGIMGRVYKDKYEAALKADNQLAAEGYLDKAIDTYLKGFEADWRDAFPGINVATLLEVKGDRQRIANIAPVVEYSVIRKLAGKTPDYWDYATLIELAVIQNDEQKAMENLKKAIACPIEGKWMLATTIKTLNLISTTRKKRNEDAVLPLKIIEELKKQ